MQIPYRLLLPAIEINRLFSMMGIGFDAIKILAWVIAVVSGLSIFISLYNSLKERKHELALMRVMGQRPGTFIYPDCSRRIQHSSDWLHPGYPDESPITCIRIQCDLPRIQIQN